MTQEGEGLMTRRNEEVLVHSPSSTSPTVTGSDSALGSPTP